jgi:hypothetical protein
MSHLIPQIFIQFRDLRRENDNTSVILAGVICYPITASELALKRFVIFPSMRFR